MPDNTKQKSHDIEDEETFILIPAQIKVPLIQGLTARDTKRLFIASVLNTEQDIKPLEYEIEGTPIQTKIIIK